MGIRGARGARTEILHERCELRRPVAGKRTWQDGTAETLKNVNIL